MKPGTRLRLWDCIVVAPAEADAPVGRPPQAAIVMQALDSVTPSPLAAARLDNHTARVLPVAASSLRLTMMGHNVLTHG